jgi:hypothetical protein
MVIIFSILLPKPNPGAPGDGLFGTQAVEIVAGWFARVSAALMGRFARANAGSEPDITSPQEFWEFITGLL